MNSQKQTLGDKIILIGFMGTGKSTVASLLSKQLGWSLIDVDKEIERKQARVIADIFTEEGEELFRQIESDMLFELLNRSEPAVIATGGGAVLLERNRTMMRSGGFVAALTASEEQIIKRVEHDKNRPLLQGDVAGRVRALIDSRRGMYDFAHVSVNTDLLSAAAVAHRIQEQYEAKR